jgi:hypothetical protein
VTVRTHRVPLSESARSIEVRNPAGTTTVVADPAAEEIVIEVDALNGLAEELIDRLDLLVTRGAVRLSVPERRLMLRAPSFAITVTTPPDVAVTTAGAAADTTLRGRLGAVTLTSGSGDLTAEHCAELQVRTASGDVRVELVERSATVATASGDVRLTDAGGPVQVRTASGDVVLGSLAADATVKSASGDVRIDRASRGQVRLQTVSGDAVVGVEPGLRIWLDLQTVSGQLQSDLYDDGPDGGSGGPQLTVVLHSVSGDLRLRRATPRPPAPPAPPAASAPPPPPAPPVPATPGG